MYSAFGDKNNVIFNFTICRRRMLHQLLNFLIINSNSIQIRFKHCFGDQAEKQLIIFVFILLCILMYYACGHYVRILLQILPERVLVKR